jgi:DNA modification methylase
MQIQRVATASLSFWPENARKHGPVNHEAIKQSLTAFGQAEPLIVQAGTNRVIGGNGRLAAMRELGWNECDVVFLDLDDAKAAALGVALNRTGELAEWNDETLAKILTEIDARGELATVGFDQDDLTELLARVSNDALGADLDEIPEPPEQATTRKGDLWVLGNHRLLCGDSASREDLDRLLAGAPIHLVNMDPPYNVRVEPRSNNAIAAGLSSFTQTHHQKLDVSRHPEKSQPTTKRMRAKDRPLANDFVSDTQFADLLSKWFGNASRVLLPGRSFYIWGGYSNLGNYPPALKAAGLYFSQAIVWNKEHPVLTRKDFMGAFELAYYGWKEGAAHEFFGPNNALDLWSVKKVNPQSMCHLTEKPVELATRAILYSSRRGENVLDLFGGSGSTLVACEQALRHAFLMELDELYCDVILTRFRELFHVEPRLEASGQTFAEVAADRVPGTAAATTAR